MTSMATYRPLGIASLGLAAILAAGGAEAEAPEGTPSKPISIEQGITPYIIPPADDNDRGGNRSCPDVGKAYFGDDEYYLCHSPAKNYDKDTDTFEDGSSVFGPAAGLPASCANTITVTVTDDKFVAWSSTAPTGAAIIKGGPASNTYVYQPQETSDSGLASPPNASGNPAGLSNIGGFCWNPEGDQGECFDNETAWAGGTRYNQRGNWATYVKYEADKEVTLYAGQKINVGTVHFSAPSDDDKLTITVSLTGDWEFAVNFNLDQDGNLTDERDENLKVQDYESKPSGNPAPGLFLWKTVADGQTGEIEVPENYFYGVHVDVALPIECPTD